MELQKEDICKVLPDLDTAAKFFPDGFQIVTCSFTQQCASPIQYIHPASGNILEVSYCTYSPIFIGIITVLFIICIAIAGFFYWKYYYKSNHSSSEYTFY